MGDALARTVRALLERDPDAFMVADRDGRGHVTTIDYHPDFVLGVDAWQIRVALVTMPRHPRKVWLAIEIGVVDDAVIVAGVARAKHAIVAPMTVEDAADWYGYTVGTAERYYRDARAHLSSKLSIPRSRARPPALPLHGKGK